MKNLKASLPATMAGIASKAGLKLAFGQPRTDGETIWVSDIPLNPTEDDYNSVVSDLIHEVGHVLYTDFSVDRGGHSLMPLLTNVFEDVRIEKALEQEFLGAASFLNEGYKVALGNQNKAPDSPANALGMFLLLTYMVKVNNRSFFIETRDAAEAALLNFGISQDLIDEIVALCDTKVQHLSSMTDVVSLSWEVINLIEKSKDDDENEPEPESEPESESDSGSGSQSSQPKDTASSSKSNGGAALLDSSVNPSSPISLREVAQEVSNNVDLTDSVAYLYGIETEDLAKELKESNGNGSKHNYYAQPFTDTDINEYNRVRNNVLKETQVLRTRLVKKWQNESRTRNTINEHDGRFSAQEAIRCMSSGESNFLIKRAKRIDNKPAVCLLGDLSHSMKGIRLSSLKNTMVTLAETCSIAQVPLNILGFSDRVLPLKKWNDPMAKARGLVGAAETYGGTDIVGAVFEGIRSLIVRKESNKILIVMTDGDIGSFQEKQLRSLLTYTARHHPIKVYGLGIDIHIGHIFAKGGMVDSDNMAETVLNILAK